MTIWTLNCWPRSLDNILYTFISFNLEIKIIVKNVWSRNITEIEMFLVDANVLRQIFYFHENFRLAMKFCTDQSAVFTTTICKHPYMFYWFSTLLLSGLRWIMILLLLILLHLLSSIGMGALAFFSRSDVLLDQPDFFRVPWPIVKTWEHIIWCFGLMVMS